MDGVVRMVQNLRAEGALADQYVRPRVAAERRFESWNGPAHYGPGPFLLMHAADWRENIRSKVRLSSVFHTI